MKLDHTKPELYRHKDGRKVTKIIKPERIVNSCATHLVEFDDDTIALWHKFDTFLIKVPKERWQGLEIDEEEGVLNCSVVQDEIGNIKRLGYAHALNLDDLTIHKL
jgi:hypothetical protein